MAFHSVRSFRNPKGGRQMARAKKTSKHNHLRKGLPLLEIAGLSLSLAGGAFASTDGPAAHMPSHHSKPSHGGSLSEEEMYDVSLATFYVFDRENSAKLELAQQQPEPQPSPSQQPQSQQSQTVTPLIKNKKTGRCGGCAGCAGCASCGASPSATSKGPTGACCSSWGRCRDC
jgi:hypothetical protein